jgi:mannose-6-phosphate isomerase-like protein (cupin superfamily)
VKHLLTVGTLCCAFLPSLTSAQTQPQTRGTSGKTAPRTLALAVEVTDRTGNPLEDVQVAVAGPVERSGATSGDGTVAFRSMRAGTYRLRFEHEGFTTLEREVVVSRTGASVTVALTPAAEDPSPAESEPEPATPAPAPAAPAVVAEPRTLSIPDYLDDNLVRSSEPSKTSLLGCAQGGTTRLMQVRDPLEHEMHAEVDEVVYVVAGEGTLSVQNRLTKVSAGYFALVPRGTEHAIKRQGRNPLIFLSVLTGAPCTEQAR